VALKPPMKFTIFSWDGIGFMDGVGEGTSFCFWVNGRWLVGKTEYDELRTANHGIVRIGWKANKLNCCSSRKDLHVFVRFTVADDRDIIGIMHMVVRRVSFGATGLSIYYPRFW
jgi:hypothetical protein